MIRYNLDHSMTIGMPENLPEYEAEVLKHGAHCFGFLLNTSEHRGQWMDWPAFAGLIKEAYDSTPQRDEVIRVMEKQ